ncbi:ribosome maturation factor RimM [Gilvimarinus xylanilyticus]|uniref:Ribosome maturation factor RimM n=1 Tax=Gilvimarinus xylanilyticus TaxID=2944139 RepID=A0A9X2KSN8_9GAMM|nr:ribosome maturation factor RimM [Gilvimarinus xylanilyticus]
MAGSSNLVDSGRISTAFGIKGWLKIQSFTEPADNLFSYSPWWIKTAHGVKAVEVDEFKPHGKGYVAHLKGVDDRDLAASYTGVTIAIERDALPELDDGEYYWHQLQGLAVFSEFDGQRVRLGAVKRLLETGANDVLVVQADDQSIDKRERLIPYVPDDYVLNVDLETGEMTVYWDPEF